MKKRRIVGGRKREWGKFLDERRQTRGPERQMKEARDEKNLERKQEHALKMVSEQMTGWRERSGCF